MTFGDTNFQLTKTATIDGVNILECSNNEDNSITNEFSRYRGVNASN